jgi:hypothetical protein
MNNTMKPPAAAKYLTPSTPCSPPPYATIKNAIAPIETPHNIFYSILENSQGTEVSTLIFL